MLLVTSHILMFLLWSPCSPLPCTTPLVVPLQLFRGTTERTSPTHTPGLKPAFLFLGLTPGTMSGCTSTTSEWGQWEQRPPRDSCWRHTPCLHGRLPALGGSCLPRSPCGMGTGMTCPWKGARSTRAVHLAFQFEKQGFFYSMAFSSLLPCSRVRMQFAEVSGPSHCCRLPKKWPCKKQPFNFMYFQVCSPRRV